MAHNDISAPDQLENILNKTKKKFDYDKLENELDIGVAVFEQIVHLKPRNKDFQEPDLRSCLKNSHEWILAFVVNYPTSRIDFEQTCSASEICKTRSGIEYLFQLLRHFTRAKTAPANHKENTFTKQTEETDNVDSGIEADIRPKTSMENDDTSVNILYEKLRAELKNEFDRRLKSWREDGFREAGETTTYVEASGIPKTHWWWY